MALSNYYECVVLGDGIKYHFVVPASDFVDALSQVSVKCCEVFEVFQMLSLVKWGE